MFLVWIQPLRLAVMAWSRVGPSFFLLLIHVFKVPP